MSPLLNRDKKIIVISNRSPYILSGKEGELKLTRSVGGLVTAVEPVLIERGGTWVAWGGRPVAAESRLVLHVPPEDPCYRLVEVPLSESEKRDYYLGFANSCLWPLSHCFIERCSFQEGQWEAYRRANCKFAAAALEASAGGELFWVHDYHFALVPQIIRHEVPQAAVALFWHIPFPPYDIFSVNPWGREIIGGMLESSLVAFHTRLYTENFIQCARAAILTYRSTRSIRRCFTGEGP